MFDANMKAGHWPFRPAPDLEGLLDAMDAHGIARAVVSSLNAVFYLNPQDGNEEVAAWSAAHGGRLVPFAVMNPRFACWADDLDRCLGEFGMKGVVLYPNYHRFDLDSPALTPLMERAARDGFPVCVQAGLEDPRRQFDREIVFDVPHGAIGQFARTYPGVTVVALGLKCGQPEGIAASGDDGVLPPNFFFDLSNYEGMGELEAAVERLDTSRMLFGTNAPLFNTMANVEKLRRAAIPEDLREAIGRGNLERILHSR